MRRSLCFLVVVGCGLSVPAVGELATLRALEGDSEASAIGARNFRLRSDFGRNLLTALGDLGGGSVRVVDWPLGPGRPQPTEFRRLEVYAPEAKIYRIDENGMSEVPRSTWTFAAGVGDRGGNAWVAIDEVGQVVAATSTTAEGDFDAVVVREGSLDFVIRRAEEAGDGQPFSCGQSGLGEKGLFAAPGRESFAAEAIPSIALRQTARIAVDVDEIFMLDRANNTTTATNYVASLISQMAVAYERDVNVTLLQGTTFLRTAPDPYTWTNITAADGPKLIEFSNYWGTICGATCSSVPRTLAMLLSVQGSGASGIAWVGGLCSNASGYSFNQMFDGGSGAAASAEARLVAHELGHNFGSPHTHCYSNAPLPRPDVCNGVEVPGCYLGAASCPAAGNYQGIATSGTIMSYCHNLGGCSTQTVFHPRTIEEFFAPNVADAAAAPSQCLYPSITPSSGPTTGGTAITIRGLGLTGVTTVTLGGVAATSVVVVNDTTITAVTGAHAAGMVNVALSGGPIAPGTFGNAFLYDSPSAASNFFTVTPCRIVDTRGSGAVITSGGPLGIGATRTWDLTHCGVPDGAVVISANVTVVGGTASGSLAFYPGTAGAQGATSISYSVGDTLANNALIKLLAGNTTITNHTAGTVHVIVDVNGYFQ